MALIGDLYYAFRGDGTRLQADAKKEGEKAGDVAGQSFAGRMKAQISKAWSGKEFGKGLVQGLGLAGGLGAANLASNAVGRLTDVMQESVQAASDQREAIALTDQVFEDSAGTISDWAKTTAKGMGESRTSAMNLASGVATSLAATGESMDIIAKKSIDLVERAGDVGSAYNATGQEVADAFKSALQGEAEPARKFGVLLSEATVKSEAYASGIAAIGSELTEAQKVQARYNLIMKATAKSAGMFGRDLDSQADKVKIATARWEDFQAQLGSMVLPKVTELTEAILGVGDALEFVATNAGPFEGVVSSAFDAASTAMRPDKVWEFGNQVKDTVEGIIFDFTHMKSEADKAVQGIETAWEDGRGAMQMAASGAASAASKVGVSTDQIVESWTDMIDRLITETSRLISDVYDPAIQHDKLTAIEADLAAEAKIQSAKDATAGEIAASQERVRTLAKDAADLRLSLLESGNLSAADTKAWLTTLERKYNSATGAARADIAALIAKIRQLGRITAPGITVKVGIVGGKRFGEDDPRRAVGGQVAQGSSYLWSEPSKPELFLPDVSGRIAAMPEIRAALGTDSKDRGGMTVQMEVYGSPPVVESPLAIAREMQRATDLMAPARFYQPPRWKK